VKIDEVVDLVVVELAMLLDVTVAVEADGFWRLDFGVVVVVEVEVMVVEDDEVVVVVDLLVVLGDEVAGVTTVEMPRSNAHCRRSDCYRGSELAILLEPSLVVKYGTHTSSQQYSWPPFGSLTQ